MNPFEYRELLHKLLLEEIEQSNEEIENEKVSDPNEEPVEEDDDDEEGKEDIVLRTFEDEFEELMDDMEEDSEESFLEYEDEDDEEEDLASDEDIKKEVEDESEDESEEEKESGEETEGPETESDPEEGQEDEEKEPEAEDALKNSEPPKPPTKDIAEDFIPFIIEALEIDPDDISIINNKFKLYYEGETHLFTGEELVNFAENELKQPMVMANPINITGNVPPVIQDDPRILKLKVYEKIFDTTDKDQNLKYTIPNDKKIMRIINKKTGEKYTTKQYFGDKCYEIENKLNDPDTMVGTELPYLLKGWMDGTMVRDDHPDLNPTDEPAIKKKLKADLATAQFVVNEAEAYENSDEENIDDEIDSLVADFAKDEMAEEDPEGTSVHHPDLLASLANENTSLVNAIAIRNIITDHKMLSEKEEKLISLGMISRKTLKRLSKAMVCEDEKVLEILKEAYIIQDPEFTVFSEEPMPEMNKEEIDDNGNYQKFKNRVNNLLDLKREKQQLEDEKSSMDKNDLKRKGKNITDEKQTIQSDIDSVKSQIDDEKEQLNLTTSKYDKA